MSYTADPAFDAAVHEDEQELRAMRNEAHQAQVEALADKFSTAFLKRALTDLTGFTTRPEFNGAHFDRVPSTVADMTMDAMECGQTIEEGIALVLAAVQLCARKGDVDALRAVAALSLAWATEHVEVAL